MTSGWSEDGSQQRSRRGRGKETAALTLEEDLQHTTGLFVDQARNTLDTTTTRETTDSGLGDTLDVVAQDLAVTLGSALAEALATLSTWRGALVCCIAKVKEVQQ